MIKGFGNMGLTGLLRGAGAMLLAAQLLFPAMSQGAGGVAGLGGAVGIANVMSGADAAGMVPLMANPLISNATPDAAGLLQKNAQDGKAENRPEDARNKKTRRTAEEGNKFQDFVEQSITQRLPMYGYDLFAGAPSTFAPVENIPVSPDYLIGPGDEIVIKGWGGVDIDYRAVVNRNGAIDIPKVGSVNLAGVRFQELHAYLKSAVGKVFRNFDLNASMGKLRTIQVFVVGQAQSPGVYTVSALSTLVNTLFASGGPSTTGSMRHIQVKRNGKVVTELDLYDLLLNGDKTRDISLQAGDVIYIPPIGQLAAIYGGVNNPAIYELKDEKTTLDGLMQLAGGMNTTAEGKKVQLERIEDRKVRRVEEFALDDAGRARLVKDGDLVQVMSIGPRFDNAVTLRGNVASPGRYPWMEGMRVKDLIPDADSLIVSEYWVRQNRQALQPIFDAQDGKRLPVEIKRSVASINWDYAVVKRLNKDELTVSLIPFNLAKAISGDEKQNLLLKPGDSITIFSSDDIQVPVARRPIFVRLEGEFSGAGVYQAMPGETLRQLVARIGGLTPNAYLFGAEFTRESVRQMQQEKLGEMLNRMEQSISRSQASREQSAMSKEDIESSKSQAEAQKALLERLRKVQATGRVVLEIPRDGTQVKDLPDLVLEDGDRLMVPSVPSVVSVMGMVYNENAFIYRPGKSVHDYLNLAGGPTRDADVSRMYVLHADGSVASAQGSASLLSSFAGGELMPGDTVIVPEMLDRFVFTKELKDWTQIFYQFALGVASIKVLRL